MNEFTKKFILQLIKKIDKTEGIEAECRIHITDHAYRWYFALNNSDKTALHNDLEAIDSLSIQYDRRVALGSFKHIDYVSITNGHKIIAICGITPQSEKIQTAVKHLEFAEFNVPWWNEIKPTIAVAWSSNKTAFGIKHSQFDRLFDAMKAVEYIVQSSDTESVPDMRTLSAILFGESKRLENKSFSNLIRRLMLPHIDKDAVDLIENGAKLLEYFGISKYPIPMRFKAEGRLYCKGPIDLAALHYGIGVSPDEVKGIDWDKKPPYVLFIENRASFERYVREIDDPGVIIYTAGFPPRSWVRVIKIIIEELVGTVPVYHWGDRDAGGYRILAFMAKRLNTNIHPYMMGIEEQLENNAIEKSDDKLVAELMKALESAIQYPSILSLHVALSKISLESLPWIEQEQISPISPLKLESTNPKYLFRDS
ncbi:Wadjet anti-phage system protein JetD domain-containing protein [Marinomonas sp. S3726]|uniref:Wadjet anti-phage system protein JetD domain-containing protein n=1 Tax=Marinomonas sp. S3726 TaxID=579484 RepID=UPI0006972BC5|nr:Wadjet anti-phage system protein JetD domain-containing protein [Marinomonas sp. S3726]